MNVICNTILNLFDRKRSGGGIRVP